MEAIVLAGGFGTRLKHIISDVPKPMAPICGKPFLCFVLDDLIAKGIDKIVLAVGYKQDAIRDYFGSVYKDVNIVYSSEDFPLLTGGAIKKALNYCTNDYVFVVNGDTFFDVDYSSMYSYANEKLDIVIAAKKMTNFDRYGTIKVDQSRVIGFEEKKATEHGLINGGVYCIRRRFMQEIQFDKFSFENDVMEKQVSKLRISILESQGYFIDIGVPEDYKKAQFDFTDMKR